MSNVKKKVWEMTADELAVETRQYDADMPDPIGQPMSEKNRLLWERWKRRVDAECNSAPLVEIAAVTKTQVHKVQERALRALADTTATQRTITAKLDEHLVARAEQLAESRGITLERIIEDGLNSVLTPND